MFQKSEPWQTGLKIFSKLLGFDQQEDLQPSKINKPDNRLFTLMSNNQSPQTFKSQRNTFQLKQKWRKLMKFPSNIKYRQSIQLLKQGSVLEDQTWVWMLKNSQKISPQLYTQRKQQFHQIAFGKNPSQHQTSRLRQSSNQVEDFKQYLVGKGKVNSLKQDRKRKFSITKDGLFLKSRTSQSSGRMSFSSQCSTFSSQTHNGYEINQQNSYKEISIVDSLFGSKEGRFHSLQDPIKSSHISSYSLHTQPFSIIQNYSQSNSLNGQSHSLKGELNSFNGQLNSLNGQSNSLNGQSNSLNEFYSSAESQLQTLPQKSSYLPNQVNHPVLASIIGAFLLHREDFSYSITLFNMTATFFYYTNSSQIKTFTLLNHVASSEFFVHYLAQNFEQIGLIINWVAQKCRKIPACGQGLRNFKLENFIENWLYGFFYSSCQNGSEVKEIIIAFLLLNNFSIQSICKVCQSLIISLSIIISQGLDEKTYECLSNPKVYLDKKIFFDTLLVCED